MLVQYHFESKQLVQRDSALPPASLDGSKAPKTDRHRSGQQLRGHRHSPLWSRFCSRPSTTSSARTPATLAQPEPFHNSMLFPQGNMLDFLRVIDTRIFISRCDHFLRSYFPDVQPASPHTNTTRSLRLGFCICSPKAKRNMCYKLSLCGMRFSLIFSHYCLPKSSVPAQIPRAPLLFGLEWQKYILIIDSKCISKFPYRMTGAISDYISCSLPVTAESHSLH